MDKPIRWEYVAENDWVECDPEHQYQSSEVLAHVTWKQ